MSSPEINKGGDQNADQEGPSDLAKLLAVEQWYVSREPDRLGSNGKEIADYLGILAKNVNGGRQNLDPMAQVRLDMELTSLFFGIPEDQRMSMTVVVGGRLAVNDVVDPRLGNLGDDEIRHLPVDPKQVVCPVTYKDVQ